MSPGPCLGVVPVLSGRSRVIGANVRDAVHADPLAALRPSCLAASRQASEFRPGRPPTAVFVCGLVQKKRAAAAFQRAAALTLGWDTPLIGYSRPPPSEKTFVPSGPPARLVFAPFGPPPARLVRRPVYWALAFQRPGISAVYPPGRAASHAVQSPTLPALSNAEGSVAKGGGTSPLPRRILPPPLAGARRSPRRAPFTPM